jgi:hypothetical protein
MNIDVTFWSVGGIDSEEVFVDLPICPNPFPNTAAEMLFW